MPKIKVGDINIYYEVHGKGEPLVLIPGLTGDTSQWSRLIPSLSKEYQVVVIDNRGAGQSDKPDVPYTSDMMADDLAGLLDAIGIRAANIFGVSMGGMIAQSFALNHPEKVVNLILGCTHFGGPYSVSAEESRNTVDPVRRQALSVEERLRESFLTMYSQEFIDKNPGLFQERLAYRIKNPIDPVGNIRQFQGGRTFDVYEQLPDIGVPTLVIAGDADRVIDPENSRILASRIPNSELVLLKGMGHGFFTEASEETCRLIIDFLKRHPQKV
jgi:pimeloyl-ACP methyl ester carboxylesterase